LLAKWGLHRTPVFQFARRSVVSGAPK
jgi:hypothetical protein